MISAPPPGASQSPDRITVGYDAIDAVDCRSVYRPSPKCVCGMFRHLRVVAGQSVFIQQISRVNELGCRLQATREKVAASLPAHFPAATIW